MSLYLKYRPKNFESLVGQDFIRDTLSQSISKNKTVGAYIFTGPRGTGKTSTARIFAKAVNCNFAGESDKKPCGTCDFCLSFEQGKAIDIIEIDAASFTGVDNIREIIEKAQFQPTYAKYKIYIIDEVHMLSKGAFNALLKILEEPPKHVKFILATTEIHKVPETILSRCQRYDFRSINDTAMKKRLEYVIAEESISIDTESLDYIIAQASGGLRNALTLLDQLSQSGKISFSHLQNQLGITHSSEHLTFIGKLLQKDSSVLEDFKTLVSSGKNIRIFFTELFGLLQTKIEGDLENKEQVKECIVVLDVLHDAFLKLKTSFDENLTMKIGIYKILYPFQRETELQNTSHASLSVRKIAQPSPSLETSHEVKKTEEPKKDVHINMEKNISLEDVSDIFGEKKVMEENIGFSKEKFIAELKKIGVKAAVTLSLKSATLQFQEKNCTIQGQTSIAVTTLQKNENLELYFSAFKNLGMDVENIKIV